MARLKPSRNLIILMTLTIYPGIIPPLKSIEKTIRFIKKFRPINVFLDKGYAIENVKNKQTNVPTKVTPMDTRILRVKVSVEKIYS